MFISKQEVQYYVTDWMGITHYSIMFDGWKRLELFSEEGNLFLLLFLCEHWILSPASLPIPPLRQSITGLAGFEPTHSC